MSERMIYNEDTKKWNSVEMIFLPFQTFRKLSIDGVEHDLTTIANGCIGMMLVFGNMESARKAYPDCDIVPMKTISDDYYNER